MPETDIPLVRQVEQILKLTYLVAKDLKSEFIETEHLLLSILKDNKSYVATQLNRSGITFEGVMQELKQDRNIGSQRNKTIKDEIQ